MMCVGTVRKCHLLQAKYSQFPEFVARKRSKESKEGIGSHAARGGNQTFDSYED
jgi:hypothetical protein